ncbi:hypothetical protein Sru01_15740 [Sphaerisporangium rufum]|uniref:Uncharacterized protein n=1 Tax=Sphaerisporangium rufum TaxID=1381558 RepID=A0A919QZ07_9ACTN|nr:hypothetical protein [Sphaerisporangium rufum]GII76592.1 hypothetical protein Sru01_15740 [Sphaerisporangium rufum]
MLPAQDLEADGIRQDRESLLRAGERALSEEGDLRAARRSFDAAYRAAEDAGDHEALARAALGLGGLWVNEHRTAADALPVQARQRGALHALDPRSPLALRLRARIAAEADYRAGRHDSVLAVLADVRQAGDPVALAEALSLAHHCVLGPGHERLRLRLAEDLTREAARTGRRGDLLMGLLWRTVDLFLAGDPHAERCLSELRELLARRDHLAIGYVVSAMEVMLAIRTGRFGHAEALATGCAERGERAGDRDVPAWYGVQMLTIRWYQGRVAEMVPALSELVTSPMLGTIDNSYFAGLAVAAAAAGDRRRAAGALARLGGRDLAALPRSRTWLVSMYGVVETAHLLGDTDRAAQAYELLVPCARLPVVASLGVTCLGSVQHVLGTAMLTCGDLDRAVEHLRAAVEEDLALGHWPAAALARRRLARALALRDGPHDATARRELALADQEMAELGMAPPPEPEPGPGHPARPEPRAVTCRRSGRQWRLESGGRAVLVDHSVGMRYLAVLLANPGHEIPAADLAAGPAHPGAALADPALPHAGGGSVQPVLDEVARREYRERLARLRAEIDRLADAGRLQQAAAVQAERDWLISELAAATGMGGRPRRFGGEDERARVSVGKAIRRALARVTEADPDIGEHLRATVHTGLYCCYRPG